VRCNGVDSRSFDDLQVTQGRKIQAQILQSVGGLVNKENICAELVNKKIKIRKSLTEKDIESVHFDIGFSVNRVGETWSSSSTMVRRNTWIMERTTTDRSIARCG